MVDLNPLKTYCVCVTEKKYLHVMIFIYNYNKKIFFTPTHTHVFTLHTSKVEKQMNMMKMIEE